MNDIFVRSLISSKGQVVIPKLIRDEFKLKPGDHILWINFNGTDGDIKGKFKIVRGTKR